jgi:anti-sigma B factor antagonist
MVIIRTGCHHEPGPGSAGQRLNLDGGYTGTSRIEAGKQTIAALTFLASYPCRKSEAWHGTLPGERLMSGPRITVIPGKKHVNQENGPHAILQLSHQILPTGEAAVQIGGELDVDTTDTAFRYVQKIINRRRGPVVVDLAGVRFCDAQGLGALVRMANYAERAGCPFLVTGPSPMLTKLIRITGLDRKFLAPR